MCISLNLELKREIAELFVDTFPDDTTRGVLEIYYGDGYAEYPMKYMNASGDKVEVLFNGWNFPDMIAQSNLIKLLSDKVLRLRDAISKKDIDYWNHLLFLLDKKTGCDFMFSYKPSLDDEKEAEIRESIGDELYEQYEREQRNNAAECSVEDGQKPDGSEGEGDQMTFQELMSFLYEEVTCEVPDGWVRVNIASIVGIVDGHNETHVVYSYMLENESQSHRFTTKNIFGPMNAIIEIERLMAAEGNGWEKGLFTFHPDGRLSLETDEKIIQGCGFHLF